VRERKRGGEREREQEWNGNGNRNGNRNGKGMGTGTGTGDRDGQRQTDVSDKNRQRQTDVLDREMDSVGQTCRTERRTALDRRVGQGRAALDECRNEGIRGNGGNGSKVDIPNRIQEVA